MMKLLIFLFIANGLFANVYLEAYPTFFTKFEDNYLFWSDGEKQIFDDKRKKNFQQLLNDSDLKDQISLKYPNNFDLPINDAGRFRNDKFFKKMYGKSKKEVEKNLTTIIWLPKTLNKRIKITKINGVDKKLQKISNQLDKLPKRFKKYLINIAGTYNWRKISGTNRLSTHSFGIAIDINVKYSNYWKWSKNMKYKNQIPKKIVEIFEAEGFIWGGKWQHYDTMHFEYRPELLIN